MNVFLDIKSQSLAFPWKILFSDQIFNDAHAERVYITLKHVQAFDEIIKLFQLWCQILPTIPVASLSLEMALQNGWLEERI